MTNTLIIKGVACILSIAVVIFAFVFFKKKRKEIVLLIASLSIAIVICEIILRIFLPQRDDRHKMSEYDATLGWKFVANCKGQIVYPGEIRNSVEINSLGFRDHAPSIHKKRKFLVLGDSFVANIAVKDNEVFTEIMETKLKNYDVLNFGVNGYGQVQEYLLLQRWFNKIDPEIIILIIYLQNDFTDNMGNYLTYFRPTASLEGKDSTLVIHPNSNRPEKNSESSWNLASMSHINILINRSINRIFPKTDSSVPFPEHYSCQWPISRDYQVRFHIMEELLLKIATFGKERDVPVIFALAPSMIQVDDEIWEAFLKEYSKTGQSYIRSLPNDRLMQFAKQNHLLMLDFFPVLHQENRKGIKLYNPREQHWTKEGNEVIAGSLIEYLKSNSLIE